MLYLVATPIGNLSDITFRAIEVLKACDYILCEDTRHSLHLLKHYEIQKPLYSFHKFSEASKEDGVIGDLKLGKTIALITDAGTPGISDPGSRLVKRCVNEGLAVQSIPGACAAIVALTASGLDTDRFQFIGFLPKKTKEIKALLDQIFDYAGTTICYESPNRLLEVLEMIHELAPNCSLAVARELTKKFEEIQRGSPQNLMDYWKDKTIKGEIVLLIHGQKEKKPADWENLSPEDHVQQIQDKESISRAEAVKKVARLRGVPKREIYNRSMKKT